MRFNERITLTSSEAMDILAAIDNAVEVIKDTMYLGVVQELEAIHEMILVKLDGDGAP